MSVTLLQLRTRSRQRADMEESEFVSDSELTSYINASIAELHDILAQAYSSDYFMESVSFTTVAGTDSYALPNGTNYSAAKAFYKLRGVDLQLNGSQYSSLTAFNFNERNKNYVNGIPCEYRLVGINLKLTPTPNSALTGRIWYIPVATVLSADGDTLDDLNQYSEYVVVDAAIKMLVKQEQDVKELMAQKQALTLRITQAAQNRDADQSESVTDVYADSYYPYYWETGE